MTIYIYMTICKHSMSGGYLLYTVTASDMITLYVSQYL